MLSVMLKSKIHGATVTDSSLDYEGSLSVDEELLRAAGIRSYEKILVANLANGERFETYAIAAPAGSREVCLNGATAHRGKVGDKLIIFSFCLLTEQEATTHTPVIVHPGDDNSIPA